MEFNLDDPLADILSDGSNDSFFDFGPKSKKQQPKQSTPLPSASASSGRFEDLFGTKDITPVTLRETSKPPEASAKRTEPPKPSKVQIGKTLTVFNDDDLMSELGFDPKKPKTVKSSILDDILGTVDTKNPAANASRPHTSGGILKDESKIISRQSTETTESTIAGASIPSISRPKTSAGPRQSIASSNDHLGLFSSSNKENVQSKEARETPKPFRRKGTTADWLGLQPETEKEKETIVPNTQKDQAHHSQILTTPDIQLTTIQTGPQVSPQTIIPSANNFILSASTLESHNTLQTLHQKESQVLLAAQMKNQEINLLEMQQKQQQLLVQQETQFNQLVQKQLARQSQLEATIRAQHERINAHIQMLMSQPQVVTSISEGLDQPARLTQSKEVQQQQQIQDVELRAEVKRLELEKMRLEDLVANVNANHEKEIEFIENSHRKQVQVIEENYQSIENRLKNELKNIDDHYGKKLEILESDKENLVSTYETKLKDIATEHADALKKAKEHYSNELDSMRSEHKTMIENIRQSKLLEFAVVQENTSYLQTLKNASSNLENVSGNLQGLRDELYSRIETAHKEQEVKLEARERLVEDKERHLKIIQDTSEQERNRLMNLVATLELQLTTLTKETSEEQWTLRQKISTLEVERAAFEREKNFAKEQLQREEKRIDELKQLQLDEQQRLMQQVQDEKQHIAIEKAKLEAAKKLQANSNNDQLKSEAEAALKVAQDAARQADQERERYLGMQRQLEVHKRELVDQENALRHKQDELESMVYAARAKERQVQDALLKMRQTEQNYASRLQVLQTQLRQTAQREAELSQASLDFARQRFELKEFRKRLELTKCSLCRIGEKSNELSQILTREDNLEGGLPTNLAAPTTHSNYAYLGYPSNAIDHLFDSDLTESLRRMQTKQVGLGLTAQLPQRPVEGRCQNVPTQTVETDLQEANINLENENIRE